MKSICGKRLVIHSCNVLRMLQCVAVCCSGQGALAARCCLQGKMVTCTHARHTMVRLLSHSVTGWYAARRPNIRSFEQTISRCPKM